MELIGIGARVVIGKSLAEGKLEFRMRANKDNEMLAVNDTVKIVTEKIKSELEKLK